MPKTEQPREKGLLIGINNLNDIELLSILLRCGTKNKGVFELSIDLLNLFDSFSNIEEVTIDDLLKIKGIGMSKATIILASIELSKRLLFKKINKIKIPSPDIIFEQFKPIFLNLTQEHFYAIYLDVKCRIIDKKLITLGNINSSIIDEKTIFKWAYKLSATGIILVHNHPSGDSTPSKEDIRCTLELIQQAELLNFTILDHIVIGNNYYSFKMNRKM